MKDFILKGHIVYSETPQTLSVTENGYLVCVEGKSAGVFRELPEQYAHLPVTDCGDRLIIPGMTDLHVHAPQYAFRSIGMDMELLDWLNTYTFPEESRYADLEYAERAYRLFADDLRRGATTRACIFATLHREATGLLMRMLDGSGLYMRVGKVNMDRNSPDALREDSAAASLEDTRKWLEEVADLHHCRPILTPRFTPSCTDALMDGLGQLQKETGLPVQSHLSESLGEMAWVQELCPDTRFYGEAYSKFGLFGENGACIMAHCVHCPDEEIELMRKNGVFIAHCPQSNTNLSSGVAPVRRYLAQGMHMGLGTDVAGGAHLSMFRALTDAVAVSKLRWRLLDDSLAPLTFAEAFYLATAGGGAFFGKTGSFEAGYACDALVLDDSALPSPRTFSVQERLERIAYQLEDRAVMHKYVDGEKLF